MDEMQQVNNSGAGKSASVPPEIRGWNWGAFFLNWIWGLGNGVYISLLSLVPVVGIIMPFILGAKGNQWAWQHQKWDSVEHFKEHQRKWSMWGVGIFIAGIVFGILIIVVGILHPASVNTSNYNQ
jgi:hypothetical protein